MAFAKATVRKECPVDASFAVGGRVVAASVTSGRRRGQCGRFRAISFFYDAYGEQLRLDEPGLLPSRQGWSLGGPVKKGWNVRAQARVRLLLLMVVAIALLSALGGCGGGGGPVTNGPLSSGNGIHDPIPRGSICAPGGHTWAFGLQQFTNYGNTTVVLDRVALLRPHNERLVGSYAVPGDLIVGTVRWPPKYPPGAPAVPGVPDAWKHRQPVHGFRLAPGKSFNMVLGVAAIVGNRRATSQGMLVYYHDSSGTYVAKNYWANIIAANTRTCA